MNILDHPGGVLIYVTVLAVLLVIYGEWRHTDIRGKIVSMSDRVKDLAHEIDGRMTQLMADTKALSHAQGKDEERAEQRERTHEQERNTGQDNQTWHADEKKGNQ